jgi:uncharacterized membrane protein
MYDLAIARILHIVGVILWIGGVAFVTTVQQEVMVGCFFRNNKNKILKRKHL